MDDAYGPGSYLDLAGLQVDAVPMARASYLAAGSWDPIATPSFRMLDREAYVSATYAKTALALRTIGGLLGGQERVVAALGDYARRHRFGHPSERDFRAAFSTATGARSTACWRRCCTTPTRSTTPWRASTCGRCRISSGRRPRRRRRRRRRASAARW